MAGISSGSGVANGEAATGLLRRPTAFWVLAGLCAALFLAGEYRGFLALGDLSRLDADDGMRLQEVRDLLGGQGWFDLHQYRYLPPAGTLMHWSRLVDAPIAAMIALFTPLAGSASAERIAITAWPVLLLLVYLALAAVALTRAVNAQAAALAVVVTVNLIAFRDLFGAGAIDHHNAQIVLLLASVLAFAFASGRPLIAAAGGIAAALSLAVGLESLPFIAAVGALYVLAWAADPSQARALNSFAAGFAIASLAAFALQTPPSLWLAPACDQLSTPWLLLAAGAWAVSLALTRLGGLGGAMWPRLAAAGLGGAALAGLVAVLFPDCLGGPYHAVPEALRPAWLELTGEAFSLPTMLADFPAKAAVVFGPTLAATIAAWLGVRRTEGRAQRLLLATASLLTLTFVLSMVQIRAIYVGVAVMPIAAGFALDRIISLITTPPVRLARALPLLLALFLFFEPVWLSFASVAETLGLRPAVASQDPQQMRACLRDVPRLKDVPKGVILGPIDLGAHILFLTDQSIVAAGYHRNVEGIIAGLTAFSGDESDLRVVATRDNADYIALCLPWIEAHPERYGTFAQALASGAVSAAWLVPVALESRVLKLWRVRPTALALAPS